MRGAIILVKVFLERRVNVEFNLTLDDVEAFNLYYRKNILQPLNQSRNMVTKLIFVLLFVVWIFITLDLWFSGHIISGIILIASIIFVIAYFSILNSNRNIRKRIRKELSRCYGNGENDILGKHNFSISPEVITDVTDVSQSTAKWEIIENVVSTDKCIFLTMTGSTRALIIPKRAFHDETSFKKFIIEAEEYRTKATVK